MFLDGNMICTYIHILLRASDRQFRNFAIHFRTLSTNLDETSRISGDPVLMESRNST